MFVSFSPLLQEKCAQYWPIAEEREMAFRDTRFLVTLLSEDTKSYYTTRVLELLNISVGWNIIYHKGNSQLKVVKENWNIERFSQLNISHGPLLSGSTLAYAHRELDLAPVTPAPPCKMVV